MEQRPLDLASYFAEREDPRRERTKQHSLLDIIIIAICGMMCGAEGWGEIEEFAKKNQYLLKVLGIQNEDAIALSWGEDQWLLS